jgi:hypothetical protein
MGTHRLDAVHDTFIYLICNTFFEKSYAPCNTRLAKRQDPNQPPTKMPRSCDRARRYLIALAMLPISMHKLKA